jgi:hypothetical protein
MGVFVRAIVYGFGFSLGSALFRKYSAQLGLDEKDKADAKTRDEAPDDGEAEADGDADDGAPVPA